MQEAQDIAIGVGIGNRRAQDVLDGASLIWNPYTSVHSDAAAKPDDTEEYLH
jgi:hypothetical protein